MNKMIGRIAATVALVALVAGGAIAQAPKKGAATCPVCHMPLSAKKTKDNPVAVKMAKGKTMYCCAKCDMKKKH